MRLNESFITELTARNEVESVISQYVSLRRRGNTLVGLCPFHNEKTGSFTVYTQTNSFYCFGCGAGGDVINFVMRIENLDYMEAVRTLADRSGLQVPTDGYDDSMQKLRLKIYEVNRAAARFFHSKLFDDSDKRGIEYFAQTRKLSASTIRHFGLGYAPDSWDALYKHLKKEGFSEDIMLQANLIVKRKSGNGYFDRFSRRVMFPIIDLRGNVIAFGGRKLPGDESSAKYINTSDTPVYKKTNNAFALNFAKNSKHKEIILCEGYMDVIAMHQAGFDNAVAACGTSFTDDQAKLLSRYTDEIVVVMDSDAAGEKSTNRTIEILGKTGMKVRVVRLPDEKDPDEFIRKHGSAVFSNLVNDAGNEIEYKLKSEENNHNLASDNGKLEYLRAAASILSKVDDPIAREIYSSQIAERFDIPLRVFKQSVDRAIKIGTRAAEKRRTAKIVSGQSDVKSANPQKTQRKRACVAEETALSVIYNHPEFFRECGLKSEDFVTDFNRRIFERLVAVIQSGAQPDFGLFSADFAPDEMGEIVMMFNRRAGGDVAEKQLKDSIAVMRDEKAKTVLQDPSSMSDDEWAENIKRMGKPKNGE